jgi:predicted metal-dependent peptidase
MKRETTAAVRIQRARTALLLDHPFFGTLLFRLKGRETLAVETMATDGISLFYNPRFVDTLTAVELCGVLAHEVLHPGLQHHVRRGNRTPVRWNMACDYAINPLVVDAGLSLPEGILLEDRFRGMSAERIYNLLVEEEDGRGGSDPAKEMFAGNCVEDGIPNTPVTLGGIGQVLDAPVPENADGKTTEEQGREWQIAVEQAETISKIAGRVPVGLERCLHGAAEARVDWRELLRRSWSQNSIADFSWMRPNRRHIWQGLYLPGVVREGIGEVVIAVDCSGSVCSRQLALFEAEIQSILEGQRPECVHVLYFDTCVQRVNRYQSGEPISLTPVGGGGTDFRPCFEWIEENGARPQMVVFLTDLYGTFPEKTPLIEVIWASTGSREAPFGQVVPMQAA